MPSSLTSAIVRGVIRSVKEAAFRSRLTNPFKRSSKPLGSRPEGKLPCSRRTNLVIRFGGYRVLDAFVDSGVHEG